MSMPVRDEGEFEIVLGNRQILAVFAIVILLMGLFFSLGYLAGKRSAGARETAGGKAAEQGPITVDTARPAAGASGEQKPQPQPAADTETDAEKSAAAALPAKEEPKKEAAPERLYVEQPPAGLYLQAAATQRADAETMLSFIMSKTGLRGYVTPSPKSPELCRVLIGPLAGNDEIAEARSRLRELGVTNAFPVKY